MEELKQLLTDDLRRMICESAHEEDLNATCNALLDHLRPSLRFQQILRELADPEMGLRRKCAETALRFKNKGNERFTAGDHAKALGFYSQALRFAPFSSKEADKGLLATIYVNRASSMHKLELFEECVRDCNRAIDISPIHTKAWYRRGKANASLRYYGVAVQDLEMAYSLQGSISEKRHIKRELEIVSSLLASTISTDSYRIHDNNKCCDDADQCNVILECISTKAKGRGMTSSSDILPSSIVHREEPLAAVVLKSCRESHCHFCLGQLQADSIFCNLCATPSYCSEYCREQADFEHRHECQGVNWPAVLPSDAVLAGRLLANFIQHGGTLENSKAIETLDLCHNYSHESPERKLELHIYAIVLSYCLSNYFGPRFDFAGVSASQFIALLCQININSMAIVYVKSNGCGTATSGRDHLAIENGITCNMKQLRVGQAIYMKGRLFNHSCQPNIHAYFLSRKLFIRATEFVPAGCPLELSYGPQTGQLDYGERQRLLKDQYSFKCQCIGCSEINISDIVIHAFHCSNSNCSGAVLENFTSFGQMEDLGRIQIPCSEKREEIKEVADILLKTPSQIRSNSCLNCGSSCDLISLHDLAQSAMSNILRLQDSIASGDVKINLLSNALIYLDQLKSARHAYSKDIAQAEDIIAEAFCLIGDFQSALWHCKASIDVLKKLYHKNHIVIGNELVKLVSLQLSLDDFESATHGLKQLEDIISLYYGSHASTLFPYLDVLRTQLRR